MKIAVIAASGRSGKEFVREALAAGHNVRAGYHGKNPFTPHDNLESVHCDASKPEDIAALIAGSDAVVSLIGHVRGCPEYIQTTAITLALKTMQDAGIRRIVSLTGTGVRIEGDNITLIDRVMNTAIKYIDPKRIRDGIRHAEILQASETDWTLLRVLKLTNHAFGPFGLTPHGPVQTFTSRAQVAQAILQVLEQKTFIKESPIMSHGT